MFDLKISDKLDTFMSSDPIFCDLYERCTAKFSMAKKTSTLLNFMLPSMLRKFYHFESSEFSLPIETQKAITNAETSTSYSSITRLAILMAAVDRQTELASLEVKSINQFKKDICLSAGLQCDTWDHDDLMTNLKLEIDRFAMTR